MGIVVGILIVLIILGMLGRRQAKRDAPQIKYALTWDGEGDWPEGKDFRKPDDPYCAVRILQERPPGRWAILSGWVPVAGTSQPGQYGSYRRVHRSQ